MIKKYVPKKALKRAKVFICGSPGMMKACGSILQDIGVDPENIYKEEFSL